MRSWRSSVIGFRPIGLTSNYLPKWRKSCTVSTATVVMLENHEQESTDLEVTTSKSYSAPFVCLDESWKYLWERSRIVL